MMTEEELTEIEERVSKMPAEPFVFEEGHEAEGYECPLCEGDGEVGYARFDGPGVFAAGFEAYGIGDDLEAAEQFTKHARGDLAKCLAEVREQRATIERITQAYAVLHARLAELTAEPPHDNRAEHADRIEALREPLDCYDYSRGIPGGGDVL